MAKSRGDRPGRMAEHRGWNSPGWSDISNIALHGLEETVMELARTNKEKSLLTIVRYADDFVVMHSDRSTISRAKE
ncbi:MAG: hypothetical protein GDA48_06650 [Hormoscilla sp. GM102CHS1]|nr:hypothetical protein [Hormoscilla sp. GM102CHS1]